MIEPRQKFWVSCATQADLDFVRSAVEGELPGANRIKGRLNDWGDASGPGHPFAAVFDLVYTRQVDADATWARIVQKQGQLVGRVIGFRANYHQCTHGIDREPVPTTCDTSQEIHIGAFRAF